ncbi:MAG: ATP-dependent DNA helicase RecG [Candidatus Omnitrophica bacterium]|nr:ATP-dependent DNA helicase RecG [Candidatus Omnitrophota bacterium]
MGWTSLGNLQDKPVRYLKGIGPKRAETLGRLGILTAQDLLYYFPRRYEDRANLTPISQLKEGVVQTIKGEVLLKGQRRALRRRNFSIFQVAVGDDTGKISVVWFNQPYLANYFKPGMQVVLYGKVERYAGRLQMSSPEFEIIGDSDSEEEKDETLHAGRIVPVYPLPEGISQRLLRRIIKHSLDEAVGTMADFMPMEIRSRNALLNLAKSLINIHFPENFDLQAQAWRRLCFDEFFLFQLPLALRKLKKREKKGLVHTVKGELLDRFIADLPFRLTQSQEAVIREISVDMAGTYPMHRLLQGDVGSGKTVVATIAGIMAIQGGFQAAFMAPTEILAKQHYEKIRHQVSGIRCQGKTIKVGLLTGSLEKKEKEKMLNDIKEGKVDLVIGTHALLEGSVEFKNLGLVVIDEQHKFGVGQRALLPRKGRLEPDVLIMTATPIPRTLAITLYADLDVSVIKESPLGRKPITTLHFKESDKDKVYDIAKEQLKLGRQAFIVYPVIEESYALDMAGAKRRYAELKKAEFKEYRLGLIHGRLKQDEQDEVMQKFLQKKLDVLVATTVLEVGIDIQNATCMIVENAQRFGLAQLHQLRGRVGRGTQESYCIMISSEEAEVPAARLEAMVRYSDGFRIAEEDLKIRGPGEFFGRRQHGLSEFKIANPLTQMQLLKLAREEAIRLIGTDPLLQLRQNTLLKERLLRQFPEYERLMVVG